MVFPERGGFRKTVLTTKRILFFGRSLSRVAGRELSSGDFVSVVFVIASFALPSCFLFLGVFDLLFRHGNGDVSPWKLLVLSLVCFLLGKIFVQVGKEKGLFRSAKEWKVLLMEEMSAKETASLEKDSFSGKKEGVFPRRPSRGL